MKSLISNSLLVTVLLIGAFPARSFAADPPATRPVINVKDFGATGDCRRVMDGVMNKGLAVVFSTSARFESRDVGKPIYVLEAGVQKIADMGEVAGAPLSSRIVEVKDPHTIVIADAARQSVNGVSVTWGTDDTSAIQRAIDSLNTTGGTVFFPEGMYRVVYSGGPGLKVAGSNIRLQGTGNASAILNSSVLFRAKVKDGFTYTEQAGVPVLYVGRPGTAIENVEVDHLWLGDNGKNYSFPIWGPYGPGVLGSAGKINHFSFHDLTIETTFLCGVNTNSETTGFSIRNVTVLSSGDHGFYLAGTASDCDVSYNRLIGTSAPMRQGIAIKKKHNIRVTHNEIANVEFQAIGVEGDDPSYISTDVLIADNFIHDLTAWHTDAISLFNAEDVIIRGNRISDVSWIAISLHTWKYKVSRVAVKDNIITRAAKLNPAFAIDVRYDPPPNLAPGAPWPGSVNDITIEGNTITDSAHGIAMLRVTGKNIIRGNRVENASASETAMGYHIDPQATSSVIEFTKNGGVNCKRYLVSPKVISEGNDLK